jgi:hypothetical protein
MGRLVTITSDRTVIQLDHRIQKLKVTELIYRSVNIIYFVRRTTGTALASSPQSP